MAAPVITAAATASNGKSIVLTLTSGGSAVLPATGQLNGFTLFVNRSESIAIHAAYRSSALQITLIPARPILAAETGVIGYDQLTGNVTSNDGSPLAMATTQFTLDNSASTAVDAPTLSERDVDRVAQAVVAALRADGTI